MLRAKNFAISVCGASGERFGPVSVSPSPLASTGSFRLLAQNKPCHCKAALYPLR